MYIASFFAHLSLFQAMWCMDMDGEGLIYFHDN